MYETKIHDIDDLQKMLYANLVRLWPGHHRCCDWPVVQPSEIMSTCSWWTLWTHALKWMFIYAIYQNILKLSM